MPAASLRIMPARTISRWETTSASPGSWRRVWMKVWVQRILFLRARLRGSAAGARLAAAGQGCSLLAAEAFDQGAQPADVAEQLLVEAAGRLALGGLERGLRAVGVTGAEAGDRQLAQERAAAAPPRWPAPGTGPPL